MREVKYYRMQRVDENTYYSKVEVGAGVFHAWGVNYEEFESGPANYSTAIVELEDGTVEHMPLDMIKFVIEGADDGEIFDGTSAALGGLSIT